LGHSVISINASPNGININQNCGAVDVRELKKNVISNKANIGFAFDGDGDRLIVVDEKGNLIDGDKILALFAKYLLNRNLNKSKNTVVSTVMSNMGFENYLKNELKISLKRTNVGDINVISEMKKNNLTLGGEQSGHIILSDYSNTGDGILAALKIIEIMSIKNFKASKLFDLYKDFPQKKINIFYKKMNNKIQKKIKFLSKDRSLIKKGFRVLIRLSGTEPVIRILVEGSKLEEVELMTHELEHKVRSFLD
jgi:phosphoglucosamine mutase